MHIGSTEISENAMQLVVIFKPRLPEKNYFLPPKTAIIYANTVIIKPIYMAVLASMVEGSFDVKRAQCNRTKTRTLKLCVYVEHQNDWVGCSVLRSL